MTTKTTKTRDEQLDEVGKVAYEAIAAMVASLNCDYDRLEELKDEKAGWEPDEDDEDAPKTWEEANEDEAEELAELEAAAQGNEGPEYACTCREDAEQRIQEDALSAQVRSDWEDSADDFTPAEFCLLLTTGGPAVRIIGELDGGEPTAARLQVQDWGTPWTDYIDADQDVLLDYARCFYFGQ